MWSSAIAIRKPQCLRLPKCATRPDWFPNWMSQAKSVYYSTKASVPQLEAGINQYITTLAILLGTYPQDLRPTLEQNGKLPDYMEPVGIGIPADLLLRRPDIRQAERQINAQAALLGASKSDWLPQVFLKVP